MCLARRGGLRRQLKVGSGFVDTFCAAKPCSYAPKITFKALERRIVVASDPCRIISGSASSRSRHSDRPGSLHNHPLSAAQGAAKRYAAFEPSPLDPETPQRIFSRPMASAPVATPTKRSPGPSSGATGATTPGPSPGALDDARTRLARARASLQPSNPPLAFRSGERLESFCTRAGVRLFTEYPRRSRGVAATSPRNVHVAAAAAPRRLSTEYPRRGRGVAAT